MIDTHVISEARKGAVADAGVTAFFNQCAQRGTHVWLSVITIGDLRRGVDLIRHRGDFSQAEQLQTWLSHVVQTYRGDFILPLDLDAAQIWGRLRVPHHQNPLDKQIAASALLHDLTLVTRNIRDFEATGIRLLNPFRAI